jgi:hypothetical protein
MIDLANFGETYTDNVWVHNVELYRRKEEGRMQM